MSNEFENFNFGALDSAETLNEINNLSFDPSEYPSLDEFVYGVLENSDQPAVKVDLKDLSVNGTVTADKMSTYLNKKNIPSSAFKQALESPAHFFFYMHDKKNMQEKPKGHFDLGTFAHLAFLEPEMFDKVIVEPDYPQNTTEGVDNMLAFWRNMMFEKHTYKGVSAKKIERAEEYVTAPVSEGGLGLDLSKLPGKKALIAEIKEVSGYTAIKDEHKVIIDLLKRNYYRYGNGIIPMLLKGAQFETSFYGKDADTGINVKVRPDAFNTAENIGFDAIISVKTTSAPNLGKYIYDTAKYKYELSEGMYSKVMSDVTGRKFNVVINIMLQTVAPYLPAVFMWSAEDLANGKYKYEHAKSVVFDAMQSGMYPGFDAFAESGNYGIIQMQQPEWAKKLIAPVDLED